MPIGISLDYENVLSTPLQGMFYGFSVCMFVTTFRTLLRRRGQNGRINYTMMITAWLLFILSSLHMAIDIYRLVVGFIMHRSTVDGPTKYFNDFGDWSWLARNLVYLIETLIGDAIMIYRCYFVWPFFKFWIILLPGLLWLATLALGITEIWANATVEASGSLSTKLLWPHRVADAYFTTTLIGNGLATGLLAYRLWSVDQELSKYAPTNRYLALVSRVVIDSGAIYFTVLFVFLCLCFAEVGGRDILATLLGPIIPICFYLIIVRLARRELKPVYASNHVIGDVESDLTTNQLDMTTSEERTDF